MYKSEDLYNLIPVQIRLLTNDMMYGLPTDMDPQSIVLMLEHQSK